MYWSCRRRTLTQILGIRLGILTLVLIVMDFFFRCQKSSFDLENNKCICQGKYFLYHVTGSTYSRIIFRATYISWIYAKL